MATGIASGRILTGGGWRPHLRFTDGFDDLGGISDTSATGRLLFVEIHPSDSSFALANGGTTDVLGTSTPLIYEVDVRNRTMDAITPVGGWPNSGFIDEIVWYDEDSALLVGRDVSGINRSVYYLYVRGIGIVEGPYALNLQVNATGIDGMRSDVSAYNSGDGWFYFTSPVNGTPNFERQSYSAIVNGSPSAGQTETLTHPTLGEVVLPYHISALKGRDRSQISIVGQLATSLRGTELYADVISASPGHETWIGGVASQPTIFYSNTWSNTRSPQAGLSADTYVMTAFGRDSTNSTYLAYQRSLDGESQFLTLVDANGDPSNGIGLDIDSDDSDTFLFGVGQGTMDTGYGFWRTAGSTASIDAELGAYQSLLTGMQLTGCSFTGSLNAVVCDPTHWENQGDEREKNYIVYTNAESRRNRDPSCTRFLKKGVPAETGRNRRTVVRRNI
jgi:hypothetical protein